MPTPLWRVHILTWIARRFGVSLLLPFIMREESREVKGYLALHRESVISAAKETALTLAKESAEHGEALSQLAGTHGEPWHHTASGGFLNDMVYGFNDGLTANFGLVAGIIGAHVEPRIIMVTGMVGLIADALSMGSGIGEAQNTPLKQGWITGIATAIGALIPVAPFFFLQGSAAMWTAFTLATQREFYGIIIPSWLVLNSLARTALFQFYPAVLSPMKLSASENVGYNLTPAVYDVTSPPTSEREGAGCCASCQRALFVYGEFTRLLVFERLGTVTDAQFRA